MPPMVLVWIPEGVDSLCPLCMADEHPPAWWRGVSACELIAKTEEPSAVTEGPSDANPCTAQESRHDCSQPTHVVPRS